MERASCLTRSKSDSVSSEKSDYLLPLPSIHAQPKIRVRTLLGHCLYRRVILWTITVLFLLSLTLFTSTRHRSLLDLVGFRKGGLKGSVDGGRDKDDTPKEDEKQKLPQWLQFSHLDGFFTGIRTLVPLADYTPEYPLNDDPVTVTVSASLPTPTPYVPYPDYGSAEYTQKYYPVKECYVDEAKTVPAPDLYAYDGVPQGQPQPALGSYGLLGLREDVCFDRFGRYGPYGLGYTFAEGGTNEGLDTEREANEAVWARTGRINYSKADWGSAQDRCYEANRERFTTPDEKEERDEELRRARKHGRQPRGQRNSTVPEKAKKERIAVVVRTFTGFQWTHHAILNFRAMVSEVSLRSGGEYQVHFLLHVRDSDAPIWADPITAQRVLDENVPAEFHGLCTLWSEAQMRLLYPGRFGKAVENPSGGDIHGVYRSAHMPLQHFAAMNPDYAHYWNWEMDMRYTGSYYELFDRLAAWGTAQPRVQAWERAAKYYVPALHGSWDGFSELVRNATEAAGRRPILGPVVFAGRTSIRPEERGQSFLPETCARGGDMAACGAGEEADLITLNPLFDTEQSGWVFAQDVTGYDAAFATPPRRCAIVTASRLSRRLLDVMHEETWRLHHSMFAEMFPASMALHHGLKAVYAPHPVYLDRRWDLDAVDAAFNGGEDNSTSGSGSPFDLRNEHNHKGTSWYYNSEFAGLLWRRWLGYAQMDGRGSGGGRNGEGTLRGGLGEEAGPESTGRMCLRQMLVHPIKWEKPGERD